MFGTVSIVRDGTFLLSRDYETKVSFYWVKFLYGRLFHPLALINIFSKCHQIGYLIFVCFIVGVYWIFPVWDIICSFYLNSRISPWVCSSVSNVNWFPN